MRRWLICSVAMALVAFGLPGCDGDEGTEPAAAGGDGGDGAGGAAGAGGTPGAAGEGGEGGEVGAAGEGGEAGAGGMCAASTLYADPDADGFGADDAETVEACEMAGFASAAGDCDPADAWRNPAAQEICGDFVDDDCDGADSPCPETAPAGMQVPDWDCTGAPPENVYAWARFSDGQGYFVDGGCFVIFEGMAGEFYVQRRIERVNQDPACDSRDGCVCPSLGGWPSYDRRLYAFTRAEADDCPEISIVDHAGEQQPVSNACRKYLYQMHFYDIPSSYLGTGQETIERRLSLFPIVEIACAEDAPHANLPYQTLIEAPIERNPDFAPAR